MINGLLVKVKIRQVFLALGLIAFILNSCGNQCKFIVTKNYIKESCDKISSFRILEVEVLEYDNTGFPKRYKTHHNFIGLVNGDNSSDEFKHERIYFDQPNKNYSWRERKSPSKAYSVLPFVLKNNGVYWFKGFKGHIGLEILVKINEKGKMEQIERNIANF